MDFFSVTELVTNPWASGAVGLAAGYLLSKPFHLSRSSGKVTTTFFEFGSIGGGFISMLKFGSKSHDSSKDSIHGS